MADVLQARERRSAGHAMPRATLPADTGHQIRLIFRRKQIHVTCRCQMRRRLPWAPLAAEDDAGMWAQYNALPHDPAAGPFTFGDAS